MNAILNETRFALRQLRKSPGFAAIVILTLALGITATTVIFSLVNAVLLSPLALPESDRLVAMDTLERPESSHAAAIVHNDTSYPNFFDWRSQSKSFSSMAAYNSGGLSLGASGANPARRISAVSVTGDFFTTLGVAPILGRAFNRSEEAPGTRTAILAYNTWKTEFSADPNILGKTIVLSEINFTIVGVMPKDFAFPISSRDAAVYLTSARDAEGEQPSTKERGYNQLSVVGRLRPGVSLAQAKAEMDAIQQRLAIQYPDNDKTEVGVSLVPVLQDVVADVKTPLHILFAAVCCLLLIVCANVAGLLLTRISQRRGELAVRAAFGATRFQLLRQLLIESLLLSVSAGILGIVVTTILLRIAPSFLPPDLPRINQVAASGEVFAFAFGLSIATGLLFGVLPAWRASQQDPAAALAESGRGSMISRRHYRLQSFLVVGQTAMGLILLVGAGLLIRSFDRTLKVDLGFNPQKLLTFRLSIPETRYTEEQQVRFFQQLLPRLQALQGVQSATAAFPLPLTQNDINISFSIPGRGTTRGDDPSARVSLITPGFFQTLQIPLLQGRFFLPTEEDAKGPAVAIVNEALARKFFPGPTTASALGQHIKPGVGNGSPTREIVGVIHDVKRSTLTEEPKPEYYIPYAQGPIAPPSIALRVNGDPASYANILRTTVASMDKGVPIYRLQTYNDELARATAQQRFQTLLLTAFAAIALLLAGLGLYAVLSYMVTQRTPELGLRLALGAQRVNVLQLMLIRGFKLAMIGLVVGIALAALLTRFVANLLYQTKPLDTATFAIMTLVLLAVSSIASLIPAWRASMLDPNETLRNQ